MRERLSERIHKHDILELLLTLRGNEASKQALYDLLFDSDDLIAYQAAWVFTHFNPEENKWLFDKQNELIDAVLSCPHPGKRRLLLNLIHKQPIQEPIRVDFLDYCLDRILSKDEQPAVNSICIKLAYELCRNTPELQQELKTILEIMEPHLLPPSIASSRNKVLKAITT